MKKLNKMFAIALLALSVLCLASCGGAGNGGGSGNNGDEPIVINYWHANGAELTAVLEKIEKSFEEKYEGKYDVVLTTYGDYDTLRDTITASVMAGEAPTAAQTYPDHVALYLYGQALQSLDKYINDPEYGMSKEEQAQFVDGFWAEGTIYDQEGTRYAMPFNKSTELMYYNQDLFEAQGWKVPQTWEEVVAICEAWKQTENYANAVAANGANAVYGMGYDSEANMFITLSQQYGANYTSFDAQGNGLFAAFGDVAADTAKSQQALSWFVDQYKKGNMATPTAFGAEYCSNAFLAGQCIMTIGSSAGATYNDGQKATAIDKFTTGVAPVPQYDLNNKQVIQQGTNVSLFICDDEAEELGGWLWLKHMVSYESALIWATNTSYFPIRKDVMASQTYQDFLQGITYTEDGIKIEGSVTIKSRAQTAGLQQADSYYTNIAFPGSSKARDEAGTIVQRILYSDPVVSVAQAYADAYNSIKNS